MTVLHLMSVLKQIPKDPVGISEQIRIRIVGIFATAVVIEAVSVANGAPVQCSVNIWKVGTSQFERIHCSAVLNRNVHFGLEPSTRYIMWSQNKSKKMSFTTLCDQEASFAHFPPPKLCIFNVTANEAYFELTRDVEGGNLRHLMLRKETDSEWTRFSFDSNQQKMIWIYDDEHRFHAVSGRVGKHHIYKVSGRVLASDLIPNTKYVVYGVQKYDEIENLSLRSKQMTFMTKREVTDTAMLIFVYWMRTTVPERNLSPKHLVDLVLRYFAGNLFEWDLQRRTPNLALTQKTVGRQCGASAASVCSKMKLSSFARWELTLTAGGRELRFDMGFISDRYINAFDPRKALNSNEHANALMVSMHRFFGLEKGANVVEIAVGGKEFQFGIGDKFRLDFDFNKSECRAFYNGKFIGVISNRLPKNVYLVATLYKGAISLETTKFDTVLR